jgi:hypothetical protein
MYARELLFEADIPRLTLDITSTTGPHWRSNVHPLFVLFANPIGSFFSLLLGGRTTSAAILFDALVGALTAVVSARLFWGMSGGNLLRTVLASLITALAMSRLFFSSIPETYALSAFSVVVTQLIFWIDLHEKRLPLYVWVGAGVLTLGVTVTNFAQTGLCYLISRHARPGTSVWQAVGFSARFGLLVVVAVGALSVVQGVLYPSTGLLSFLQPTEIARESWFLRLDVLQEPWEVLSELFRNVFMFNVVGGIPQLVPGITEQPRLTFGGSWAFSALGYAAIALWAALAVAPGGRWTATDTRVRGLFYAGVASATLFNLLLHAVYFGKTVVIEYFLYTANFTFPVMVLVLARWVSARSRAGSWALGAFLALLAANNLDIMRRIIEHYR